jgi:hypothetical protein
VAVADVIGVNVGVATSGTFSPSAKLQLAKKIASKKMTHNG